jgi:outer membrane protein assembly factor BamB
MLAARITLVVVAVLLSSTASAKSEWPQFRGTRAGVADDDPKLPDGWSRTENVVWQTDIPGTGWSSPIVSGEHIFLTAVVSDDGAEKPQPGLYSGGERPASKSLHRWMVYDVDFASGKVRWEREVRRSAPLGPKHVKNTYATETPITDGERVYVYFGGVGLFAFTLDGEPVWSAPLVTLATRSGWGTAASPVLVRDRLVIVNDNDTQSYIAAYDTKTGHQVWRVDRNEGTNWATPFVWRHERGTEIVTVGTRAVRSYDPDGRQLWELTGMSSITAPTPFAKDGLLYMSSGFPGDARRPVFAVRPGASGDISLKSGEASNEHIAWFQPLLGSYTTSALAYGDYYYTLLDRGFLLCHDARTGREVYGRQRLTAGGFTASPWAYNGKIFAMSEEGDTYVIQAGPEFKILGKNSLDEMTLATPAVAGGSLIVRTLSKLYRISAIVAR